MRARGWAAVLAFVAVLLAAPAASAATFTVNETTDTVSGGAADGICDAEVAADNQCTLREAVKESNTAPNNDTITFSSLFDGAVGTSTIDLGNSLNADTEMTIDGGDCGDLNISHRPCVGLRMTAVGVGALEVFADGVDVRGLAVTNVQTSAGIGVGPELSGGPFDGLTVGNSWLGLDLDGAVDGNTIGLRLRGNTSLIGGKTGSERNVFAGNGTAVKIEEGADHKVRGNYFGVEPDGVTADATTKNTDDTIHIDPGVTGSVIGASVSSAAQSTTTCDGGCNLIANGGDTNGDAAIRTEGEGTTIKGNFIGLDKTGNVELGNQSVNIDVLGDGTTVGGETSADRNFIAGGALNSFGVDADAVDDLAIKRNYVGLNSAGTAALDAPNGSDISVVSTVTGPTTVSRNRLSASGGDIAVGGNGARVVRNKIGVDKDGNSLGANTGGSFGIVVTGTNATIGEPGAGNTVGNAFAAGIKIEGTGGAAGDGNVVQGNFVGRNSDGDPLPTGNGPGILLKRSASTVDNNKIGGTSAASENVISNSKFDAIAIEDAGGGGIFSSGNQVKRNRGKDNGEDSDPLQSSDLFIDLGNDGVGNTGINGGVPAPGIDATNTSRTHTEGPCSCPSGSTIYIFRTSAVANFVPSRVNAFVDTANPDDVTGNWSANFPQIPAGQNLVAFQLDPAGVPSPRGTSELSPAIAP